MKKLWKSIRPSRQYHRVSSVISTFSWGGQIFFYFSVPLDYWKIGKNSICSNLTLFIVLFLLSFFFSLFSLFSLFSFFSSFFLFFFFLGGGGGRRPPQPPLKWRLCIEYFRNSYFNSQTKFRCFNSIVSARSNNNKTRILQAKQDISTDIRITLTSTEYSKSIFTTSYN